LSLQVRNTHELINPDKFKWKALVFALSGMGKTEFVSDAPNPIIGACETGEGNGLLTVARKGLDYCEPADYTEFESFCGGHVGKDKDSIVLDSLSAATQRFIKDKALSIARKQGDSGKRSIGIPELDDYGSMGELMRRAVNKLIDLDKHVFCTALMRFKEPSEDNPGGQILIGPDLPGAMMLGSTAMFDTVMCLKTRAKLRDPKDPKSRYVERFFVTTSDGQGLITKCRSIVKGGAPILPAEIVWNLETGEGNLPWMLAKIKQAYGDFYEQHKGIAPAKAVLDGRFKETA